MKIFKKKIPHEEFWSVFPIIDIELCNDVRKQMPDGKIIWDTESAIISCTGILEFDNMEFFVAEKERETEYIDYLKKKLSQKPFFYAFNTEFEFRALKGFLGIHLDLREIRPFKVRHGSKENMFKILHGRRLVKTPVIDPYENNALLCVEDWKAGKYDKVVEHNTNCLLKESSILKHKNSFFLKNFGVYNEWLIKRDRPKFWMELGMNVEESGKRKT
jgi:hypothetical protein